MGYKSVSTGAYKPFHLSLTYPESDAPEEFRELIGKIHSKDEPMSQEEKEAECDQYLYNLYGNDRFVLQIILCFPYRFVLN